MGRNKLARIHELPTETLDGMGTILARDMKIVIADDRTIRDALNNGKPNNAQPVQPTQVPVQQPEKSNPWLAPLAAAALALGGLGSGLGLATLLKDDQPPVQAAQPPVQPTPQINITSPPDWKARAYVSKPEAR